MNRRLDWRATLAAAAAAVLTIATAVAQQPRLGPIVPKRFTAPDGSRFVLIPSQTESQVHWTVATLAGAAEEPPGLAGLATAVQLASLEGTWPNGSNDVEAERAALDALDQSYADLLAEPGDPALMAAVRDHQLRADQLGDRTVFRRVLATTPAHDPRISVRDSVALLELTTIHSSIAAVGALLVERREQQALRGLPTYWLQEIARRQNAYDRDPLAPAYAELLALAMPGHPESRASGRPGMAMPRRAQAMRVWQTTQHPRRTVHVLYGAFDPAAARTVLTEVFASTALPDPPERFQATPRPGASLRRSTIPGTGKSVVALAWVLPAINDPLVLRAATLWLGDGEISQLATHLRQNGRKTATVRSRAPWPITLRGRSLMLVEVEDPAGTAGLADLVMQSCRKMVEQAPKQRELNRVVGGMHRNWSMVTAEPRWLGSEIARDALLWPARKPTVAMPMTVPAEAVHQLLTAMFAGRPVIVETQP